MEDLVSIHAKTVELEKKMEAMKIDFLKVFREKLWSSNNQNAELSSVNVSTEIQNINTPVQAKKKPKRLSSLNEDDDEDSDRSKTSILGDSPSNVFIGQNKKLQQFDEEIKDVHMASPLKPEPAPRKINLQIEDDENENDNDTNEQNKENNEPVVDIESVLMPPPPAPIAMVSQSDTSIANQSTSRPQRAAKLKSEKLLKEPKLKTKLRRPDDNEVKVKLEHENRASQMGSHNLSKKTSTTTKTTSSLSVRNESTNKCEESVLVIANKAEPILELSSDDERQEDTNKSANENKDESIRSLCVKVKREKSSLSNEKTDNTKEEMPPPQEVPMPVIIKSETTSKTARAAASKKNTTASSNSTLSTTASTTKSSEQEPKKTRKKNEHKPIKVERFSDIDRDSPVSTRSRRKKELNADNQSGESENAADENVMRPRSIYEDAVDSLPNETTQRSSNDAKKRSGENSKKDQSLDSNPTSNATMSANTTRTIEANPNTGNATMVLDTTRTLGRVVDDATMIMGSGNLLMNATKPVATEFHGNETFQVSDNNGGAQTTFVVDNPNATRTISSTNNSNNNDENDVSSSTKHSMETARDTLQNDSIITNDESFEDAVSTKGKGSAKSSTATLKSTQTRSKNISAATSANKNVLNKMTPGKHELFNPLLQSPVKYRVEAFEHAAQAAKADNKKVPLKKPSAASCTTPTVGRLQNHATSRFLTPTQASNITQSSILAAKKAPNSASKAMAFPKTAPITSSTQAPKTLSRENSGHDFRKNIQQLTEERKKQREQKHLLAAQQRDAKERERAERYNRMAKEKEEKRLKKKELEEIQQKLRLQEEAEKQRIAKERELALLKKQQQQQMAMKSMMPPAPKQASKYTFDMLHEDDSTDEETKTSYKRPPPPAWSRSHVRGHAILAQQSVPTAIIDSFFSVAPTTPDLREIFPNIDAKHLKRNSSAMWTTPPRYSELPKY